VLELLLPRRCLVCAQGGALLCARCRAGLPRLTPPLCGRCGAPTAWPVARCRECAGRRLAFARARAAVPYEGGVRSLVGAWKERGLRPVARLAAELALERLERPDAAFLTFVPPDGGRLLERGYHPAERFARDLAAAWELPCLPLLRRAPGSRRQRGLTLAERRSNVRDGFAARPVSGKCVSGKCVSGKCVSGAAVLVDDVYTSGATVHAAAAALCRAGAGKVEVVTFARTIRMPRLGLGRG
jgi:predicted amidophosphoribosyltransferase